jgi:hypothetical protein
MLNYLKKFALDILPSVAATIIGAYIVNHYIGTKPDAPAAAVSSTATSAEPKKARAEAKAAKPAEISTETAAIPEPGIRAKGISARAMIESRAAENPAEVKPADKPAEAKSVEAKSVEAKPVEAKPVEAKSVEAKSVEAKSADAKPVDTKPTETASASVETRRHATAPNRDANDLARAAIERLRGSSDSTPRAQDAPHSVTAPAVAVSPASPPQFGPIVRPLPPPIALTTRPVDSPTSAVAPASPPYTASVDPNRPTPPAEIPPPPRPPLDLRAGAAEAMSHTKNVAEDMLAATKSMFHALLPGSDQNSSNGAQQFTD